MLLAGVLGVVAAAGLEPAGSRACVPCHAAIYRSYAATPMARTSGRVGAASSPERFERSEFTHARSGVRYRAVAQPDGIDFEFTRDSIRGRRRLDFYIGSGAVGRSYALLSDGFLFQAPVSYYSAPARWDVSPGFGERDRIHLGRPIEPECLACHATDVRAVPATQRSGGVRDAGIGRAAEECPVGVIPATRSRLQ